MAKAEEYEVVRYPRLKHVTANIVHIVYRNRHVHREMELGIVLDGTGEIRVRGRCFAVHARSLMFFNSNESHEIISGTPQGLTIAYVQIANNFCRDYLRLFHDIELSENDPERCTTPEEKRRLTRLLLDTLAAYYAEPDDGYALRCISCICTLFAALIGFVPYRKLTEADYLAHKKRAARLRRITEYIDAHYSERITLSELAQRENLSTTYLSHFIHDNLNMTFQEYLGAYRFEKALSLMNEPGLCLTDVSMAAGFSDVKYFTRMFEKRFGCSPKAYRGRLPGPDASRDQSQNFADSDVARRKLAEFAAGIGLRIP